MMKKPIMNGMVSGAIATFALTRDNGSAPLFQINNAIPGLSTLNGSTRYLGTIVGVSTFLGSMFGDYIMDQMFPFVHESERMQDAKTASFQLATNVIAVVGTFGLLNPRSLSDRTYLPKIVGLAVASEVVAQYINDNYTYVIDSFLPF
jgi:hypothetical protein